MCTDSNDDVGGFTPYLWLRTVRNMRIHDVRTRRSAEDFPRSEHLAWKIAEVAADPVAVPPETESMVINRIIDNASVSAASVIRRPVTAARAQALAHPVTTRGAKVFGVWGDYSPEWAAWANGVAVRELDFHDTFLTAEYSHPDDNIPPIVAVAQHLGLGGADLIRAIATGCEIQVDLVKGMCLHEHKIAGFDISFFTPIFVMSRIAGWTAHIMEQTASNALIRPLSEYVGPPQRELTLTR